METTTKDSPLRPLSKASRLDRDRATLDVMVLAKWAREDQEMRTVPRTFQEETIGRRLENDRNVNEYRRKLLNP